MPKSRGRKPAKRSAQTASRSGDPRRRAAAAHQAVLTDPAERAAARVAEVVAGDASDPRQVTSVPPLFIDVVASGYALPAERCVDDCVTLVHAYTQLGIPAQVRVVELAITDTSTGTSTTHGSLTPQWEDGLLYGHTVVWLPDQRHLVDVTAEQYPQIDAVGGGPVIATCAHDESVAGIAAQEIRHVTARRGKLLLTYALAPQPATAAVLDHPVVRDAAAGHRRRGLNVASAAVALLAECLPPERITQIPHQRVAALVEAIRDLPDQRTPEGDWRFLVTRPGGKPVAVRLDHIALPKDTPPAAATNLNGSATGRRLEAPRF